MRAAIDGGHFDLGAESGFGHCDGDGDLNVVAHARKDRIRACADDEEEIACGTAVDAGIALALQADALAVTRARLDAEFDGFGGRPCPRPGRWGNRSRCGRCRCNAGR